MRRPALVAASLISAASSAAVTVCISTAPNPAVRAIANRCAYGSVFGSIEIRTDLVIDPGAAAGAAGACSAAAVRIAAPPATATAATDFRNVRRSLMQGSSEPRGRFGDIRVRYSRLTSIALKYSRFILAMLVI